jgi:hypothetical protein
MPLARNRLGASMSLDLFELKAQVLGRIEDLEARESGRTYSPSSSLRWKSEGATPRRSGKWMGG